MTFDYRLNYVKKQDMRDNWLLNLLSEDGQREMYKLTRQLSMEGVRKLKVIQQNGMNLAREKLKTKYTIIKFLYKK